MAPQFHCYFGLALCIVSETRLRDGPYQCAGFVGQLASASAVVRVVSHNRRVSYNPQNALKSWPVGYKHVRRRTGSSCISSALSSAHEAQSTMGEPPRHPIYWIDEVEPHNKTRETAARSARNLPIFLENKGIAPYNAESFREAHDAYLNYCAKINKRVDEVPLVLDSCCGTGRSTWNLAHLRPDAFIIGVDKSLVRLTRNAAFRGKRSLRLFVVLQRRGTCGFLLLHTARAFQNPCAPYIRLATTKPSTHTHVHRQS